MVDRLSRAVAAAALRDSIEGSISNKDYEARYPTNKDDPALWGIYIQLWFHYSDVSEHHMTNEYWLTGEERARMERCVLFLENEFEFLWPPPKFRPWYGVLRLFGLGKILTRWEEEDMSIGDIQVWPFFRRAEYLDALRKRRAG